MAQKDARIQTRTLLKNYPIDGEDELEYYEELENEEREQQCFIKERAKRVRAVKPSSQK